MNDPAPQPAGTTAALSGFLATLRYEQLPAHVVARCEDLFLDWFACTLAGRSARPIGALERFAAEMGPAFDSARPGSAQILTNRTSTSPLFAALVNGGASHVVEQDDLHNSSVLHPA
ncbi:MAG: MmgE/PrpD family protein, partial [Proteobacteria bacterium]|nr:MmgE/PrpD family protein [Burkholderiales bacterium]